MNILENDIEGQIGTTLYECHITWRNGTFVMDEPINIGGQNKGPDPYSTLLASLAGCTLSTLRMYIDRKGWNIPEIKVSLNLSQEITSELITTIQRSISFSNEIPDEQKERLMQIASKCPVSKILENKITINTTM